MAPLKQAETLSDANLRRHLLLITLPCKEILCKARHKVRSPNLLVVLPNFKEVLNLITIMAFLKQAKPLSDANPRRHLLPPPLLHNETLSNAMHLLKYLNNDMLSNASHLVKSLRFQPPNSVQAKLGTIAGLAGAYIAFVLLLTIPAVQDHVIFLHRVTRTWGLDVNVPEQWGFLRNQVTPFQLKTLDGETLHAWHVLPLETYRKHQV
ncbi:hypothetical protein Ptr902_00338 [Pyrenophora tritici-repentis]|nr:hypothetical protein Ptr902_00338 [Pyrenophora tritici-repentis]